MKVKPDPGYRNIPVVLLYILYIAFFIGFIFSFRAVSSISIALLVITVLTYNQQCDADTTHSPERKDKSDEKSYV